MITFASLQEVMTDERPWKWLSDASIMQKHIVQWFIAMYGLSYSKTVATHVIKQMVIVLCEEHEYLDSFMTVQEAEYSVALNNTVINVKHAAGMSLYAHPRLR
jgi:hypothetical protein